MGKRCVYEMKQLNNTFKWLDVNCYIMYLENVILFDKLWLILAFMKKWLYRLVL